MSRFASKVVVSTVIMLLALASTGALGVWQYTRAHRADIRTQVVAADAIDVSRAVSLGEYLPEAMYGHQVLATGRLDCSRGFTVSNRLIKATWLICPLIRADQPMIAVALGESTAASWIGINEVTVTGRMQPAQDATQLPALYEPASRIDYYNTDDAVHRWQSDVLDGFVAVESVTLSDGGATPAFIRIPASRWVLPPVGIELRNLFYAWQWWLFAVFAVFLWLRYLRDEWQLLRSQRSDS